MRKLVYAGIVLLLTSCVPIGVRVQNMKGERRHTQFYWEDMYLASFYASCTSTHWCRDATPSSSRRRPCP